MLRPRPRRRRRYICAYRPAVRLKATCLSRINAGRSASYCAAKGWEVVSEFVEPGNTATDDRRPSFQAMIDAALTKPPTFTFIVVHSFSRFFRDQFQFEFYVRKLAKNGVRLSRSRKTWAMTR